MANQLDSFFSAMADPTRRAVVEQLLTGPATVSDLYDGHDMALPSFMKHLRVLEGSGIVTSEKAGRVRTVTLEPEPLATAEDWLRTQRRIWEGRLDRLENLVARLAEEEDQ